jgi:hypothetical protein
MSSNFASDRVFVYINTIDDQGKLLTVNNDEKYVRKKESE